jgi:acetyl-CoA acetyltransferase
MATVEVEIAGVGIHPFGRFEGKSVTQMGVEALRDALHEAGIGRGDFQAAFCGTAYSGVAAGHKVLGALALTSVPIVDIEAGCASGGAALQLAVGAIAAEQFDTVLVFGIEKMPKGIIRSSFFDPWREQTGLAATPSYFALRAQKYMRETGVTKDDLADVVVKNRRNGAGNPNAMFRKPVTAEEVLASRLVCDPLHLFMLCSPNEGAAAVIVRKARKGSGNVRLLASSLKSHLPGNVLGEATPLSGIDDSAIPSASRMAADSAYEMAGIGPDDVDVVECQDTDACRELISYEELRLCEPGDAVKVLRDQKRIVTQPSGGLISKGEPVGASALGQAVEIIHQLRGQAGPRQVEGARVGLSHTVGRGANACVMLMRSGT